MSEHPICSHSLDISILLGMDFKFNIVVDRDRQNSIHLHNIIRYDSKKIINMINMIDIIMRVIGKTISPK